MTSEKNMNAVSKPQPQQMALRIFEDIGLGQDLTIMSADQDIGYNKSKILVDVGDLGLVARRALNGCYYIASTSPERSDGRYDVGIEFFKWLINYSSNNMSHLRKALRDSQKASVQVNDIDHDNPAKDKWLSVPMLGTVGIAGGRIVFEIHRSIAQQLADPQCLTYLSLRMQAAFTSCYALELYEKLWPFRDIGESPWFFLEHFCESIKVKRMKSASDFRYLRRDVIQPSIDQINDISDIFLTLETRSMKGSRKIEAIRFLVKPNPTGKLNLAATTVLQDTEIYETLTKEFCLGVKDIEEITSNRDAWSNERILQAIEYARHAMNNSKNKIKWPGMYLMKTLREGYGLGFKKEEKAAQTTFALTDQEQDGKRKMHPKSKIDFSKNTEFIEGMLARYADLPLESQDEIWEAFKKGIYKMILTAAKKTAINPNNRVELLKDERVAYAFSQHIEAWIAHAG